MKLTLKPLAIALVVAATAVSAQAQEKVKIGFITDMSSLYADVEGKWGASEIGRASCRERV